MATTSTATPATTLHASPQQGIGYSLIAASSDKSDVNFTMTADSGASSHFVDNQLITGIEQRMLSYVHREPSVTINVAGGHRLSGVGKAILIVHVEDQQGIEHPVQLPVTMVPGLGRHLFSGGTAATKGVSMVIAARYYLDMETFKVDARTEKKVVVHTSTGWDLAIALSSVATESAFPTISGNDMKPEHVVSSGTAAALATIVEANIWQKTTWSSQRASHERSEKYDRKRSRFL